MISENSKFTIGVTGHRDLIDDEYSLIKQNLTDIFNAIKQRLPNTEVRLLSGMADGADRLVADVALLCGMTVEAILPMPIEIYKDDFDEASFSELQAYYENENFYATESVYSTTVDFSQPLEQSQKNQCYAEMGQELIDRSILLTCLWDGQNAAEEGGTSDILLRFLESGRFDDGIEQIDICKADETLDAQIHSVAKLILWQPVNRIKNETKTCEDLNLQILIADLPHHKCLSLQEFPEQFCLQLYQLDCYNVSYNELDNSAKNVYDNRLTANIDWLDTPTKQHTDAMDVAFVKADNLAMHHQKFSDKQFKIFAYMAASMGICFLVYAKIVAAKIFIILYALLFIVGLFIFKKAAKQHSFTGHLTSRIIAESYRVRIFLALAGVDVKLPVEKLFKLSGVKQFSGFNWINWVLKPLNYKPVHHARNIDELAVDYTIEHWIEDQANYFSKKTKMLAEQHHHLEKIKTILLTASFLAALALIFFKQSLVTMIIAGDFSTKSLLVFLMGLLPLLLGIWEIYQGKMAIKELHWQYKNQSLLFKTAYKKIKATRSIKHQKKIIFELGEYSLMEIYLWSIHRYHREHEPPSAG